MKYTALNTSVAPKGKVYGPVFRMPGKVFFGDNPYNRFPHLREQMDKLNESKDDRPEKGVMVTGEKPLQ